MTRFTLLAYLAACDSPRPAASDAGVSCVLKNRFQQSVNRKLDLVFTIDDSPGMQSLQEKLAKQLPDFIRVLSLLPGGLPEIHIGVVSSSLGGGRFANVPGCSPGTTGDNAGRFIHPASCTALAPGQSFIIAKHGITNFTGEIGDIFGCMANLGSGGCPFSQPFAATRRALEKAADPLDPDNGGFLRPDAYLAIVLLTNQDDCSIPASSDLFDPTQMTLGDPYGGLQPYRCSEFGHLCGGQKPPHDLPTGANTLALGDCTSAEDQGQLSPVSDFVHFLSGLKASPSQILVSAAAGPPTPYVIEERTFTTATGGTELQPVLGPSCVGSAGEYGAPSPRVKNWLDSFGTNGVLESVCADDLTSALIRITDSPSRLIGAPCIQGTVATRQDGTPDCQVARRLLGDDIGTFIDLQVPLCDAHQTNYPCWMLLPDRACSTGQLFRVCYDPTCALASRPSRQEDALVTCALQPPC